MNKKVFFFVLPALAFFLLASPLPAHANESPFDSFINGVKEFVGEGVDVVKDLFKEDKNIKNKNFTVVPEIAFALNGDSNKNNEIDGGDIVTFSFKITNNSEQTYNLSSLKTNIIRNQLSFIHNIKGATGISDNDGRITLENVSIQPQSEAVISFDAQINYYQEDKKLTSEPEFLDSHKKSIAKSALKEVIIKKLTTDEVKARLKQGGKTE